jgi:hypothetical protein
MVTVASIPGRRERPAMVTAPGSYSGPGLSANVGIGDAAESRSHARAGCGSRSTGGCRPGITRVQSPHGHGSSAASVVPSRLRGAPLAGSRYGSPAAWLTCGSGTGPAPAAHRRPAVRPIPRRTASGPPHLAPGSRPAPMPAPPRPRAAARRPPAALLTAHRHKCPSALRWAPKPAATQPTPAAVLVLNRVVRVCASRVGSEETQTVCGG